MFPLLNMNSARMEGQCQGLGLSLTPHTNWGTFNSPLLFPSSFLPKLPPSGLCKHKAHRETHNRAQLDNSQPSPHREWTNNVEQIMCSGIAGGMCINSGVSFTCLPCFGPEYSINIHWSIKNTQALILLFSFQFIRYTYQNKFSQI